MKAEWRLYVRHGVPKPMPRGGLVSGWGRRNILPTDCLPPPPPPPPPSPPTPALPGSSSWHHPGWWCTCSEQSPLAGCICKQFSTCDCALAPMHCLLPSISGPMGIGHAQCPPAQHCTLARGSVALVQPAGITPSMGATAATSTSFGFTGRVVPFGYILCYAS